MVKTTKKIWQSDFFGIFCFNLLALFATIYVAFLLGRIPYLSLVTALGNLLYLIILFIIRLRLIGHVIERREDRIQRYEETMERLESVENSDRE